jgi:FlaA1/EpsC-like NDP-sugar epimerase
LVGSSDEVSLSEFYRGKTILITGSAGFIGGELIRRLLKFRPKVIRALDNDENGLFNLDQSLHSDKIRTFIGDVRDKERLGRAIEGVDIVFHAAALKHVHLCEYNPFEAIKTNVLGTQNVIEVAVDEEVDRLITISTDKAVNPMSVMGATKLLAERLTIAANYYKGKRKTIFSCVRFGNVLSSRGSVMSVFKKQIEKGGPVTITDPRMTRFVMIPHKAVELILKAAKIARGGEVFILKMHALCVVDLAEVMIEELAPKYGYKPEDIEIRIIGKRLGEKLHEELMTKDEMEYVVEKKGLYILSLGRPSQGKKLVKVCTSDTSPKLGKDEIRRLFRELE